MSQRIAGLLQVQVNGMILDAKGSFSYSLGYPKRENVMGADGPHGYKEVPQTAFIEGAITDRGNLDLKALVTADDQTVTLTLANGKTIVLGGAWYAAEGTVETEESELKVRWESRVQGREIT